MASLASSPFCCLTWPRSLISIARARRRRVEGACRKVDEGRACCGMVSAATTPTWATSSPKTNEIGAEEASQQLRVANSGQRKQCRGNIPTKCTDQHLSRAKIIQGVGKVLALGQRLGQDLHQNLSSPSISPRRCAATSRSTGSQRASLCRAHAREKPSGSKCSSSFPRG